MSEKPNNPQAFPGGFPEAGYEPCYGMTLRDWFATSVDKDEFGDLIYRNLSRDAMAVLVGSEHPEEPSHGARARHDVARYQIERMEYEMKVRAAVRYRFADAMLAERERGQ